MANSRLIEEGGVIVSKYVKKATEPFEKNGRQFPAQPEKNILVCVSGESYDKLTGFKGAICLEYAVGADKFDMVKYGDKVQCLYEMTAYGNKPQDIEIPKA